MTESRYCRQPGSASHDAETLLIYLKSTRLRIMKITSILIELMYRMFGFGLLKGPKTANNKVACFLLLIVRMLSCEMTSKT